MNQRPIAYEAVSETPHSTSLSSDNALAAGFPRCPNHYPLQLRRLAEQRDPQSLLLDSRKRIQIHIRRHLLAGMVNGEPKSCESVYELGEQSSNTADMNSKEKPDERSNRIKDPNQWVTGGEEMTGAQASYLHTLAQEAHEPVESELTKAEASKEIDRLRDKTGRAQAPSRRTKSPRQRRA